MKKIIIALTVIAAALLLPGCSHNTGAFTLGTRVNLGIDPQNATANASYTDGLNVIDVSRENASWDVEIDADNGVSVDNHTGNIKGVKRLRREVGPQITGYLVDLADKNPEMAKAYVEAMKLYWQYRLTTKPEAENNTVIHVKEDNASKPQENGTKAKIESIFRQPADHVIKSFNTFIDTVNNGPGLVNKAAEQQAMFDRYYQGGLALGFADWESEIAAASLSGYSLMDVCISFRKNRGWKDTTVEKLKVLSDNVAERFIPKAKAAGLIPEEPEETNGMPKVERTTVGGKPP